MQLFDSDLLNPKESPHLRYDLQGKTAIITGASRGLGEQFAHCLSGARARVLLAAQLREVSRGRRR